MAQCETLIWQGKGNKPACTEGKFEICDVGLQSFPRGWQGPRRVVLTKQSGYKGKKGNQSVKRGDSSSQASRCGSKTAPSKSHRESLGLETGLGFHLVEN